MAATTPHPDPLPPPRDAGGLSSDVSDYTMYGCIAAILVIDFIAGFVCGAVIS